MSPPLISSNRMVGSSITGMERPAVSDLTFEIVPGVAQLLGLSLAAMSVAAAGLGA